jgi:peptidoglycan/LPS O-acetylase OafA/YrhL
MVRNVELDAIRGIAALVIVWFHLWWMDRFLPGTAVDCFFVLSGYLITSIILKHAGSKDFLLVFYARRGLRIWPIYYLVIVGVAAINAFLPHPFPMDGLIY